MIFSIHAASSQVERVNMDHLYRLNRSQTTRMITLPIMWRLETSVLRRPSLASSRNGWCNRFRTWTSQVQRLIRRGINTTVVIGTPSMSLHPIPDLHRKGWNHPVTSLWLGTAMFRCIRPILGGWHLACFDQHFGRMGFHPDGRLARALFKTMSLPVISVPVIPIPSFMPWFATPGCSPCHSMRILWSLDCAFWPWPSYSTEYLRSAGAKIQIPAWVDHIIGTTSWHFHIRAIGNRQETRNFSQVVNLRNWTPYYQMTRVHCANKTNKYWARNRWTR